MAFKMSLPGTQASDASGRATPRARHWRIFWSYLPDWILTIFLWAIFYLLDKVDGYRRMFSVTDTSLAYPYADPERIKVWHLAIYAGIIPALIIILTGAFVRRSVWDVHAGILGFILALGLTVTFTDIIKITAGRPRPDLFDRCQLPESLTSNPVHGLVSWTACTRTDLLQDGFRSFPSGHSSFAWAGMWYLILYSAAKMRISNRRGYTWKSWILLAPLSCAALVSISRTMDYRHHATDVIAGAIIGILAAWFSYRQFYPPLGHPQAYKPYSPRVPKDEEIPLHRAHHHPSDTTGRLSTDVGPQVSLLSTTFPPAAKHRVTDPAFGGYPPNSKSAVPGGQAGDAAVRGNGTVGKYGGRVMDYEGNGTSAGMGVGEYVGSGTGARAGDREVIETVQR